MQMRARWDADADASEFLIDLTELDDIDLIEANAVRNAAANASETNEQERKKLYDNEIFETIFEWKSILDWEFISEMIWSEDINWSVWVHR